MSDTVVYRAKIGLWVYLFLFMIVFNLLTTGCLAVFSGKWLWFPNVILMFCGISILLQLVFLAYYTIDGKNKWIRSGPYHLVSPSASFTAISHESEFFCGGFWVGEAFFADFAQGSFSVAEQVGH